MKCICSKCGKEVPSGVKNHFTAEDGRIYCKECSKNVKECSKRIKEILIKLEEKE